MKSFKQFIGQKKLPIGFLSIFNAANPTHASLLQEIDALLGHPGLNEDQQQLPSFNPPSSYKSITKDDLMAPGSRGNYDLHRGHHLSKYADMGHSFYHQDLSDEERKNIENYTLDSGGLNRSLVKAHHTGTELQPHYQEWHNHLLGAARKGRTPHDMVLYSGVGRANPGRHRQMLLPAYSSMTLDPLVSHTFARYDETLKPHERNRILRVTHQDGSHSFHMMNAEETHHWFTHHGDYDKVEKTPEQKKILNGIAAKYGHYGEHDEGESTQYGTITRGAKSTPMAHVLKIHLPAGSNALHVGGMSHHGNESEIIAPPKSVIRLREHEPLNIDERGRVYWPVDMETPKL